MSEHESMDLLDRSRIELTLQTRERIIKELISGGIPKDSSDRMMLMQSLDGLDRTIFSKAKIKLETSALKNQEESAKLIANVLNRLENKTYIPRTDTPLLNNDFVITDLVEDETLIGIQTLKFSDIIPDE